MYYCPNCKKKFRQHRKQCPICGSTCRYQGDERTLALVIAVGVLLLILCSLLLVQCNSDTPGNTSDPSSSAASSGSTEQSTASSESTGVPETSLPPETSVPPETSLPPETTAPPETTLPPETTAPPTQPPVTGPIQGSIGMYTREELEALDNTSFGYGPGPNRESLNFRPEYAVGDQKRYEKYGANFIAPDNGNVYLTFDCGYEYYTTDANGNKIPVTSLILDTLKEKNVKGVFFITMPYAKGHADLVRRMIDEGHTVGNHSNHHPVMTTLSIDKMVEEVMSLHDYVLEHFDYEMTLFRPPTGAYSVRSLAVVQNLGYKTLHWSFAYADWEPADQPDPDWALENALKKAHSGAIYLLHAVSETNAAILGDLIDGIQQKGFNLELFQ